ncbi:MAG: MFS transporter [Ruminococcaceae bacterium]|nr:MFS transporter [Oscillospiraceae bacterium]
MLTIAICVYLFICIVGFYMGYSLEPSQQAYDQAYTRHFQQAFNTTSAEPLAEGARDRYEDQKKALLTGGRGILSAETRAADFAELVEEQIELTKTIYPAESDQRVVATALTSFGKDMAVFFNNPTAAADYDKALNLAGMLFWAMAVLVGLVQGGIQAISRSFFGKLVPPKRSSEYFGFFDIFGKFAAVIGPALYAFSGAITGKPYIGILSLILLFVAGLVVMFIGRHYLAAAEASGRASENGSNVH